MAPISGNSMLCRAELIQEFDPRGKRILDIILVGTHIGNVVKGNRVFIRFIQHVII